MRTAQLSTLFPSLRANTIHGRIELASHPPAGRSGTVTFLQGDESESVPWTTLLSEARSMAAALQDRGIGAGDHVAVLGPTSRLIVTAIEATWLCGACVVMLPLPMRLASIEQFVSQTRARISNADAAVVLIDRQFEEFIQPVEGEAPFVCFDELLPADPAGRFSSEDFVRPIADPDALAVLQFTSGSTSEPKGVMLTHRAVCANHDGAIAAAEIATDEVLVSWLPLYHDMGLIGLLGIPMVTGLDLVLAGPQDFMARPARWMQWISDFGGTCTAGPNFSYVLATRALRRAEDLDLSTLRIALNGAEPIDCDAFRAFAEEAGRFGMRSEALFPAFGMAEVCIAGVFPPPGVGMRTDVVDSRVLETESYAAAVATGAPNAREFAVLGRAVPGMQIRVVDPLTGRLCREREVGELQITGSSLTDGYYRLSEATAELIVDGWLRTGDLAYLVDDEMVMCGRIKDMIIIGGRNIFPQDVEAVVGAVEGVRAGNVIAFSQDGRNSKQHIVVVAETRSEEPTLLRRAITHAVNIEIGIPPRQVVLVPPGTVPKTSSGKLQRAACRRSFERGELEGTAGHPVVDVRSADVIAPLDAG